MSKRISDIDFVSYVVERDIDLLFLEEFRQTGESSVVRMEVPIVDAYKAFDGQTGDVRTCLQAAKRLLNFYRENESRVVGIGS